MENILKTMLEYNDFSNTRYIDILTSAEGDLERELFLFSHILNAHHIWNRRINNKDFKHNVWEAHKVDYFAALHEENLQETNEILSEDDLDRVIVYHNSKGDEFSNIVGDMLLQALNHGTYHRGQIAQLLRAKDIDPPGTDFITFKRMGQ